MTAQETAAAVLARAAGLDPTIPRPDAFVLASWADILGDIDTAEAVAAVVEHYTETHRRVMPSDVLSRVKARRAIAAVQDEASRDFNAVPDADPDDVPAWLLAKRQGRLVNHSPREYIPDRPVRQIIDSALRGKGVAS